MDLSLTRDPGMRDHEPMIYPCSMRHFLEGGFVGNIKELHFFMDSCSHSPFLHGEVLEHEVKLSVLVFV